MLTEIPSWAFPLIADTLPEAEVTHDLKAMPGKLPLQEGEKPRQVEPFKQQPPSQDTPPSPYTQETEHCSLFVRERLQGTPPKESLSTYYQPTQRAHTKPFTSKEIKEEVVRPLMKETFQAPRKGSEEKRELSSFSRERSESVSQREKEGHAKPVSKSSSDDSQLAHLPPSPVISTPWIQHEEDFERNASKNHAFKDLTVQDRRPQLEPPRLGLYALYYILTKVGILSDAASHWEAKQAIELNDQEMTRVRAERLEEIKKALEKESASKRWSIATQIFSWMTSFLSIITGVALIVTGVAAVAGALLLVGGIIALTNQLLEVTGGWNKIAESLPGDCPEKKRAIVTWMQIGIAVLCLLLSGAGVVFGGFGPVSAATSHFMSIFGGVILVAGGATTIGEGVILSEHSDYMAKSREQTRRLTQLKHRREDLMETIESGIPRLKQLFEEMVKVLEFEAELFRADQAVLGR